MRWMNSSSKMGTHHIFFAPRFQPMLTQQQADSLSSHLFDDTSVNDLFHN
jgi:hypothetical protein